MEKTPLFLIVVILAIGYPDVTIRLLTVYGAWLLLRFWRGGWPPSLW